MTQLSGCNTLVLATIIIQFLRHSYNLRKPASECQLSVTVPIFFLFCFFFPGRGGWVVVVLMANEAPNYGCHLLGFLIKVPRNLHQSSGGYWRFYQGLITLHHIKKNPKTVLFCLQWMGESPPLFYRYAPCSDVLVIDQPHVWRGPTILSGLASLLVHILPCWLNCVRALCALSVGAFSGRTADHCVPSGSARLSCI